MAASGGQKSEKLDEAQALARSCAGRPDFLPCDGLSICATHSHGKCFKLHWCCHLGWCHCKYVYQPMTSVCQLPSTLVPVAPSGHTHTMNLSISLAERFLRTAPKFRAPPCLESPKFCIISDLFVDDYMVKRINGKMCYVQRPPPPAPNPTHQPQTPASQPATQHTNKHRQQVGPTVKHGQPNEKTSGPKMDHCSSPSSSEDSGINALGLHYMESCDEDSCMDDDDDEEEDDDELSTDGDSSPGSLWDQDECTLLSPSKSMVEIIEKIETTV
ncbi:UPF0524 protein C3orf70 homolog [Rhinichthys klamathensis goyatoka]|uniref:UPF0524 protein C3orf70 homolog n=1 Tax=Rhinichthys klamathensis goyatoka TaxID=3034132 RepID=UPI0024B4D943|nr:UPF0524 protein C3orf70 homolog [Rhinichthys klamathensis goyatoka]